MGYSLRGDLAVFRLVHVLYIAGIHGIPTSLYEASYLDGAGKLKTIWHVTLLSLSLFQR